MIRALITVALLLVSPALAQDSGEPTDLSADALLVQDCLSAHETAAEARVACEIVIVRDCLNAPGGTTTLGMVDCSARAEGAWDEVRHLILSVLEQDARARDLARREQGEAGLANHAAGLLDAEQAWEVWRDLECIARERGSGQGSMGQIVAAACRLNLTRERVLDHWYR